jgi:adenosylcobyric acid synthase
VILPGTKSTMADLAWLRRSGLADVIASLARDGVALVGICGGYQMLGAVIRDPHAVERLHGAEAAAAGLGLLPVSTTFEPIKATHLVEARVVGGPAWMRTVDGPLRGYEIHCGQSDSRCPWLSIRRSGAPGMPMDGACSDDGRVWGCYLHGLFANDDFRKAWLASLGHVAVATNFAARQQAAFDRLADVLEASLNMAMLERIVGPLHDRS